MAVRHQHARTSNRYTVVDIGEGVMTFFNESLDKATVASMRRAALRFCQSGFINPLVWYYEGRLVNGRWQFTPVGTKRKE